MSGQVLYGKSNVKNIGEYHDLYLKIDVYLVTDVFFGGGNMCLNCYGPAPAFSTCDTWFREAWEMEWQCFYDEVKANNECMNEHYDKLI